MPDLSKYDGLITICLAKTWDDQKECILKRVEKSRYREACMWFWVDDRTRTNPDAKKEK